MMEITPAELADALKSSEPPVVIDVREEEELEVSALPAYLLIPMGEFTSRVSEVPRDRTVVVACRSGSRSGRVVAYLQSLGYDNVKNLAGGLNRWAAEVDSTLPQY